MEFSAKILKLTANRLPGRLRRTPRTYESKSRRVILTAYGVEGTPGACNRETWVADTHDHNERLERRQIGRGHPDAVATRTPPNEAIVRHMSDTTEIRIEKNLSKNPVVGPYL